MSNYYNKQWRLPNNENKNKVSNYSMYVDSTPYIKSSLSVDELNEITISLWFKTSLSNQSDGVLVSFPETTSATGLDISFQYSNPNEKIRFNTYTHSSNDRVEANFNYSDNNWHHLICSYNGSVHNIYIDGVLKASESASGTLKNAQNEFFIGAFNTTYPSLRADNTFFDQVCVFNYPLSDGGVSVGQTATGQIATLYGGGSAMANPMTLSPKPVAYYPLGDQDSFNGAEYLVPNSSLKDYVFDFDGTDDYIDLGTPAALNLTQNMSISAWINTNTIASGTRVIICDCNTPPSQSQFCLEINRTAGKISALANGTTVALTGSTTLSVNTWYHVALTRSGSAGNWNYVIYLNGVVDGSVNTSSNPSSQQGVAIGRFGKDSSGYFNGSISDVQIFNTALPATGSNSIETLYNNGSPLTSMSGFTSLQGWWKLDASELYSDKWSVENNAIPTTFKSALNFDGNNDYIDLGNLQPSTTSLSISAWAYKTDATNASIIGRGASVDFNISIYSGSLIFGVNSGSWSTIAISNFTNNYLNQWFHVCATWDGSTMKLYLNGNEEASASKTGTITYTSNDTTIGKNSTLSNYEWDGKISNVAIYNTALSPSNIQTLYNNGVPQATIYGSPVAHYKLDNTTSGIGNSLSPYSTAVNFNYNNQDKLTLGTMSTLATASETTFAVWVKATRPANQSTMNLIYSDSSGDINLKNNGASYRYYEVTLKGMTGSLQLKTPTNYATSLFENWHHVAVTLGTTEGKLYLNGVLEATKSVGTASNLGDSARLGEAKWGQGVANYYLGGFLSNFAIFNTALSGPNIATLYNNGQPELTPSFSPVHYWKLDNINTGLNDTGSLASNNATRGVGSNGTGSGPTTGSSYVSILSGTNNGATEVATYVNRTAGTSSGMTQSALQQSDLSFKTSFSPYAFDFDGTNQTIGTNYYWPTGNTAKSISLWFYKDSGDATLIGGGQSSSGKYFGISSFSYNSRFKFDIYPSINFSDNSAATGKWQHVVVTAEPSGNDTILNGYVDGVLDSNFPHSVANGTTANLTTVAGGINTGSTVPVTIGENNVLNYNKFPNGKISNISIWNTPLTSSQVREIYNEGVPSNLNNHSAYSNLVSWWQLGSNSSYTNKWIVLDEKGTNNGESVNMDEADIVDGVGSYGNGLTSGFGGSEIKGDSPYSTANALSSGMDVLDRTTDTPS